MWLDRLRSSVAEPKTVDMPLNYQPRATRFHLEVAASFDGDGSKHDGQCVNVSNSGLLVTFNDPPELWTEGKVSLEAGGHYISINARVARIQGKDVGFAFLVTSDNDRAGLSILINSVVDRPLAD